MAEIKGTICSNSSSIASKYRGLPGDKTWSPSGAAGAVAHYRVRAWNLTTVAYEFWDSSPTLSLVPPSGNPVSSITVLRAWEQ